MAGQTIRGKIAWPKQKAREIAFCSIGVIWQWTIFALAVYVCITIADYLFRNLLLKIIAMAVLAPLSFLVILPLFAFLGTPIQLVFCGIIDFLFPRKE